VELDSPFGAEEMCLVEIATLDLETQIMLLTVKIRQPSHEFTFGVGMSFIPYPLVLTPVV
jgi:hypothetical protein